MTSQTFTDTLRIEVATLQARHPEKEGEIARAHALIVDGWVRDNHDGTGRVLASSMDRYYTVNGACECEAAAHSQTCKHLTAWRLYQRVAKKQAELAPPPPPHEPPKDEGIPPPEVETVTEIPRKFITVIKGKNFVQYVGLLAMAHERGLAKLEARFISVTAALAVAEATATFQDGSVYSEAADATPENVNKGVKDHFARCALTRAKARALRDGLNIAMCSVEEVE